MCVFFAIQNLREKKAWAVERRQESGSTGMVLGTSRNMVFINFYAINAIKQFRSVSDLLKLVE